MVKVNVEQAEFFDLATGEVKKGYRHPVTHQVIFEDADEVEVSDAPATPEPVEPDAIEINVDDARFEALPEADDPQPGEGEE